MCLNFAVFCKIKQMEKKSRFTFTNNLDTALTPHEDTLPKKRIRLERASSSSSDEHKSKKRLKKDKKKKDKKDNKRKRSSSSESSESSGNEEQRRIRNAAIAEMAGKFNVTLTKRAERDTAKDESLPKVN
jgi:hypothetical protein